MRRRSTLRFVTRVHGQSGGRPHTACVWYTEGNWSNDQERASSAHHRDFSVISSPLPDIQIPPLPFHDFIYATAVDLGRPAYTDCHTKATLSFGEARQCAANVAGVLHRQHNIGKRDCVALFAANHVRYLPILWGMSQLGAVLTPVNPASTTQEVLVQLSKSGAKLLIVDEPGMAKAQHCADRLKIPLLTVEQAAPLTEEDHGPLPVPSIDPAGDTFILPYSSGTTGLPKGTMLTHTNMVASTLQFVPGEGRFMEGGRSVVLCPLPFYHIYGIVMASLSAHRGVHMVHMSRFDLPTFCRAVEEHKVTRACVAPPILVALAKDPRVSDYDLSSLECLLSGAAPLAAAVERAVAERLGCIVKNAWGMTEIAPAGSVTPDDGLKPGTGTCGQLVANSSVRVVCTETDCDLPAGKAGELLFKGPNLMKGYHDNPEATKASMTEDGFFKTGDIAWVDEDGYLYVVDRTKELIKYKGKQVAPAELEDMLLHHPAVRDAIVIGLPSADGSGDELPAAYVALNTGHQCTEEDLCSFVGERVSPHKRLRGGIRFTDQIPKTPSGKLLRRVAREMAQKELARQKQD